MLEQHYTLILNKTKTSPSYHNSRYKKNRSMLTSATLWPD